MKKIETIWHYLLYSALEKKQYKHTQQDLAGLFGYSLSTVHHALNIPAKIGAINKQSKFFVLQNFEKMLYYWASVRNLEKDIIYQTYYDGAVLEIEGLAPPGAVYGCYSAVRHQFGEPPADYSEVYLYLAQKDLAEAIKRFPANTRQEANVFILKLHPTFERYGKVTTWPQTFVDLWNLKKWYASDFCKFLEEKMYALLS